MPPNQPNPAPTPPVVPPVAPVNAPNPGSAPSLPSASFFGGELKKAESAFSKDWKSPAFWVHAAVQVLTWLGYVNTTNDTVKIGTLTLSGASLIAYLYHLALVNKS